MGDAEMGSGDSSSHPGMPSIEDFIPDVELDRVDEEIRVHEEHEGDDGTQVDPLVQVNVEVEPQLNSGSVAHIVSGMEFSSVDKAYAHYLVYSYDKGFGIRNHSTCYSRKDRKKIISKTFVCNKEGATKPKTDSREKDACRKNEGAKKRKTDSAENVSGANKPRWEERTGCKAMMRINLNQETGMWCVGTFVDEHNHAISCPSKVGNHRCHRNYHRNPVVKDLVHFLSADRLSPPRINKAVNAAVTTEAQTITPQQCNDINKDQRKSNIGRECSTVIKGFLQKRKQDPLFYFSVEVDKDSTLRSVFWSDGRSRSSYMEFADVVVFDVTYRTKTNSFKMPFAPFTGVNHHRQSTLFGCALLADETEETFVWLFTEWLDCMFGKAPSCIITDQDPAICAAIKRVFPHTRHRYCSWHVNKHATEHLGLLHPDKFEFAHDYHQWLYSESITESEMRWDSLKDKHKLGADNWLVKMYEKRKHWVPAYLRDVFTAGMRSSQRNDSINALFDHFVWSSTQLPEFVTQYDKVLKTHRRAEKYEDFRTMNSKPTCQSGLQWEKQAGQCYTRKMYTIFHAEFIASQAWYKRKKIKNGDRTKYFMGENDDDYENKWRKVVHDVSDGIRLTCSCAKFETEGMLCRHIMAIMRLKQIRVIPDRYVLRRWTIEAQHCVASGTSSLGFGDTLSGAGGTPIVLFSIEAKHHKLMKHAMTSPEFLKSYNSLLDNHLAKLPKQKPSINVVDSQVGSNFI